MIIDKDKVSDNFHFIEILNICVLFIICTLLQGYSKYIVAVNVLVTSSAIYKYFNFTATTTVARITNKTFIKY